MKFSASLFLALALYVSTSSANNIKADIYSSSTCTGTPQETLTYTLNSCKDVSQSGVSASMKPTICNTTWASISGYVGSASCAGSPSLTQTGVPGTCINDGSGSYVKITCNLPNPAPIKSSASELAFGLGALILVVASILV